jgi:hypothetical protein
MMEMMEMMDVMADNLLDFIYGINLMEMMENDLLARHDNLMKKVDVDDGGDGGSSPKLQWWT